MATQQSMDTVQKAYIGYYGRPADPAGLEYWADRLENEENGDLSALIDAFGNSAEYTSRYEGQSNEELVNNLYQQLFNRDAEEEGLNFYVGKLESGEYSLGDIAIVVMNGAQNSDVTALENKLAAANAFTKEIEESGASYGQNQIDEAVEFLDIVDADNPVGDHAAENVIVNFPNPTDEPNTLFTLVENTEQVLVTEETTQTVIYWGYNPHAHGETDVDNMDGNDPSGNENNLTNEGPQDGGVKLEDLLTTLSSTGIFDLSEVFPDMFGDIDVANPTDFPFANVTNLTIGAGADGTSTVTVQTDAGEVAQAEVELGQAVLDYMDNLLFDEEGNSRLYEVEETVAAGYTTQDVLVVLTDETNSGNTEEVGFTSDADNTIVAGRLDLLHGAYIDGGSGDNTLEIDAKGHYAQPKQLLNIQTINIENLPNVYTDASEDNQYPDVQAAGGDLDSIIDLSRAVDLEDLTITEGQFTGLDGNDEPGMLTVAGVRGNATVTLEGAFTQNLTVHFSEGAEDGTNLVLNLGEVTGVLSVMHNSETLNIDSIGGGNVLAVASLGTSTLMNLNVSGDAKLYLTGDLGSSFAAGHPATIDASENTAGVDLTISHDDEVVFTGTANSDDHFNASSNGKSVLIDGGNGNNEFVADSSVLVTITSGDGDNQVSADDATDDVMITLGDGNNEVSATGGDTVTTITLGAGDNEVDASEGEDVVITATDGDNEIVADNAEDVVITLGDGDNVVSVQGTAFVAAVAESAPGAGDGEPEVPAVGDSVEITAGNGDNAIAVSANESISISTGTGDDGVIVGGLGTEFSQSNTALINIDLGTGDNVLALGDGEDLAGVTALEGSTIEGSDITLVVNADSDLQAVDSNLENVITDVVMADDATLTLTAEQFMQIGAENFSVDGTVFSTHAVVNIIVTSDMSLDELNVDALPRNVDLSFEVHDAVTLSMTAEQLHMKVIDEGVKLAVDDNEDVVNGSVEITGGGTEFDPFNSADTVKSNIAGNVYNGGSLDPAFDAFNVSVQSVYNGYDRPADVEAEVVLTIDADMLNGEAVEAFNTWHTNLEIIGDADVMVDGTIDLGVQDGDNTALNDFTVDFSTLNGALTGLTLGNFDNAAAIIGNGTTDAPVRIDVELGDNVATADQGLVSSGVQTYVVVEIDDSGNTDTDGDDTTATFYTCETTQDLDVLGLQGNYDSTITFANTERGVEFLMEVDYAKSDGYVVGTLNGEFARDGADAVVNVVALQELPAGEMQMVKGISFTNADTATINVTGGNTEIEAFSAAGLEGLTLTADANLEVTGTLPTSLTSVDASGVIGSLDIELGAPAAEDVAFVGAAGATTLTLSGAVDEDDFASIEGAGGVALVIDATVDLTETTLTNVTSVTLEDGAALTLTMEQADAIGAANFMIADGDAANLTLEGLSDQEFSVANYADGITVAVTLEGLAEGETEKTITLHEDTDLTDIATLAIPEGVTLNLTAAQFQQLDGAGTLTGDGSVHITDLSQADAGDNGADLDLTSIAVTGSVTVTLDGSVDLTEATLGTVVDTINIGANESLTLDQIADADGVAIVGGAESTLTFTDTVAADPADLIDASGFDMTYVELTNAIASGNNIDEILGGLPGSVTKVIYKGYGEASTIDQTANIEAATIVTGTISFDTIATDVEIANFTLNLLGGSEIDSLDLSTTNKFDDINDNGTQELVDGEEDLQRSLLDSLTINSTGVEVNPITNTAVNTISGNITATNGAGAPAQDNNLLTVNINAEQALDVDGMIEFSSVVGDDDFTANDDDEATATLNVDGTAAVDLGGLDTSDAEVTGLVVNHTGTGSLEFTLNGGTHTVEDFTVNGSADADTVIVIADSTVVDVTEATLVNVDQFTLEDNAELTVNIDQLDAIGIDNIVHNDFDDAGDEGALNIGLYDGREFDFNMDLQDGVDVGTVTFVAGGEIEVNSATDFTGIAELAIPADTTVTLTDDQFKQLVDSGAIISGAGSVVVDVDADMSIGTADETTINGSAVSFVLADGITLDVETLSLANGLDVSGAADALVKALVNFTFEDTTDNDADNEFLETISVALYQNVDLRILDDLLDNFFIDAGALNGTYDVGENSQSIEDLLVGLENANILNIYREDPAEDPDLDPRDRVVVVEPDAAPDGIEFSANGSVDYVRSVNLTLQTGTDGDALINGDIVVNDALEMDGFTVLTITTEVAEGEVAADDAVVTINGAIKADDAGAGDAGELQEIDINAAVDLVVTGAVTFNSETDTDYTATLDVATSDAASVTIEEIAGDTADIEEIVVNHTGDGELNLTLDAGDAATTLISFSGDGINLTIDPDATDLNLSADDLTAIDSIFLEDGASLTLSLAQVLALTEANLTGDDDIASTDVLNINGFDASEFDITDYTGIDLGVVTIDGDITLDANTNLTGATIVVPEGSTLTMTAAQYMELSAAAGNISGAGSVNITDLDAASNAIDLSTVTATGTLTLTLGEDVDLDETADLGSFAVELTDGQTINFYEPGQVDGLTVTGTATSIVEFGFDFDALEDTNNAQLAADVTEDFGDGNGDVYAIDLSNIDVGELHVLEGLVEGQNVEQVLAYLDSDVEVVVYSPEDVDAPALGNAFSTERVVTIVEDATVGQAGGVSLVFADLQDNTYVRTLTLNLEGNATVEGLIDISTLTDLDATLTPAYFETLSISSTGATANTINDISGGSSDNAEIDLAFSRAVVALDTITAVVNGNTYNELFDTDAATTYANLKAAIEAVEPVTVTVVGDTLEFVSDANAALTVTLSNDDVSGTGAVTVAESNEVLRDENNLLAIEIDADTALSVGTITFTSVNASADDATATLDISGDAVVTIDGLDVSDTDVDALVVTNASTAELDLSLSAESDDAALTIDGGAAGVALTIDTTDSVDLSAATLTNVNTITLETGSTLTLSADQLLDVGVANLAVDDALSNASLVIADYEGDAIDFTALDAGITSVTLNIADTDGVVVLDAGTNLTGVTSIVVPAGTTLELTADQFEQLGGLADAISGTGTVNITDLDSDNDDINLGLIADTITAGTITLDATATTVTLTDAAVLDVDGAGGASNFGIVFGAEGQTLELATEHHADGRTIDGSAFTTSIVKLDFAAPDATDADGVIESGNFDISDLHVWDDYVESFNGFELEDVLHDLSQDTTVTIFDVADVVNPATPDVAIDTIVRNIVVQEDTDVAEDIIIDDENDDREIAYVNLTLEGNASIQDLNLRTTSNPGAGEFDLLLQELNIVSSGDDTNTIGDITAGLNSYKAITQTMDRAVADTDTLSVTINGNTYSVLADIPATHATAAAVYAALEVLVEAGENIDVTVAGDALTFAENDGSAFTINADLSNDDNSGTAAVTVTDSATDSVENNLLDVNIDASQALEIDSIEFSYLTNSLEDAGDNSGTPFATRPAELTVDGTANVTITSIDAATDTHLDGLTITNDGTGTLTVTGASPSVTANGVVTLVGGDMVFGTGDVDVDGTADSAGFDLSSATATAIDASGVTGDLDLGTLINVGADFTLTGGTGVTTVSLAGTDDTAAYTVAADSVVTIDLSNAAAGSSVTLDESVTFANGGIGNSTTLTIDTGAGDLDITGDVDLTTVDVLDVTNVADVVLADDATLSMTDAQFAAFTGTISGDTDLVIDAARLVELGSSDLTDVRGLTSIDLDDAIDLDAAGAGTAVTLTVAQFDITTVTDSSVDPVVVRDLVADEFIISDTWANISAITDSTLVDSFSYEITDLDQLVDADLTDITAEQAGILLNASNAGDRTATITVDDTWANWQDLVTAALSGNDDNALQGLEAALDGSYDFTVSDIAVNQSDLSIEEAALLVAAQNYDPLVNFYSIAEDQDIVDVAGDPVDITVDGHTIDEAGNDDVTTLLEDATSVNVTGLTVAQYNGLVTAVPTMNLTGYTLVDTWAILSDPTNDAARDNAVSYSVSDLQTQADANFFTGTDLDITDTLILRGASNFATVSPAYDIADAVANYFSAGSTFATGVQSALNGATAVTVIGIATAGQGAAFETTSPTTLSYAVEDTLTEVSNVVEAAAAAADAFANATTVEVTSGTTGSFEALTASEIGNLVTAGIVDIDLDGAGTLTLSAAQYVATSGLTFADETLNVSDNATNLADDAGDLSGAGSVTVTDTGANIVTGIDATLDADVTVLNASDDAITLTYAQFQTVDTASFAFTAGDTVTVTGGVLDQATLSDAGAYTDVDTVEIDDDVTVTLTAAQLNAVTATIAADADGAGTDADIVVNTLDSATVAATALVDTFELLNTDTGVSVTGFLTADDTVALDGGTGAVVALAIAGIDGSETLILDTAANLGALAVNVGNQSGGSAVSWAVASDTGAVYYDADGDWTAGSVAVGIITADSLAGTDFTI